MTDCTKLLFTKKTAAQMLDLSVRSVDYLLASRELEHRRVGRKVLIPRASLVRFAARDHSIDRTRTNQQKAATRPMPINGGFDSESAFVSPGDKR